MNDDIFKVVGIILVVAAIVVGAVALSALIIMLLWNALVPALITGGPTITYWQAILVNFALSIFGGLVKGTSR